MSKHDRGPLPTEVLDRQTNIIDSPSRPSRKLSAWLLVILLGCSRPVPRDSEPPLSDLDGTPRGSGRRQPEIVEPYRIDITGRHKQWHIQYPGCDERVVKDIAGGPAPEIHLPTDANVVLVLRSADFIYTLAMPTYAVKEIAVPELEFRVEFHTAGSGRFDLKGDELCGDPCPELNGSVVVEPRAEFARWLTDDDQSPAD